MKPELRPLRLATRLRWHAFSLLERFGTPATAAPGMPTGEARSALWVFVSTIGEVNAIAPFLRELVARHADLQLVLLTDRSIYREAYLAQFPQAEVVEIGASGAPARQLAQVRPPRLFVVAEIPCLPADAPCRLPIGYLYQAHQAGAKLALVNGWLYGYAPDCRMDRIERGLLTAAYLELFDLLCVQTAEVAEQLITQGARRDAVHVTGNIKFDALQTQVRDWQATRSPITLHSLEEAGRPTIVAGCVTDDDERDLVLDAFQNLLQTHPTALLVLAPRHPENPEVMRNLHATLKSRKLAYRCRSVDGDQAIAPELKVLVLDTMGELRDFYARADATHVGRDHNVLEPLAFGKAVTVRPGWDKTYPSFPVFQLTQAQELLNIAATADALAQGWHQILASTTPAPRIATVLQHMQGATQSCHRHVEAMLTASHASP